MTLTYRLATLKDNDQLTTLMHLAITQLMNDVLTPAEVEASFEVMGLDSQLIKDSSYFIIEDDGVIAGCGGWSFRETLFGGNHSQGRDPAKLDPARDAARIRAMYTHPDHTRKGVGKLILKLCETAALDAGFSRVEMGATLAGEKLYTACGYTVIEPIHTETSTGITVPILRMGKKLY